MKRKFEHPAPSQRELAGPKYWRSLDELSETPGFREHMAREFPEGASSIEGVDRRQFMKLMAASFALGGIGLAGCRRPEANILPYGKSVEYTVPGLPLYFATAMPLRKSAIPLLAETHQGRPTKVEGNPSYLPYGGGSSISAQSSVLDLYDPERAMGHVKGSDALSTAQVNDLLASIRQTYSANGGAGLAFLADESSSPTRARLVAKLKQEFPRAIWAEYEPVQDEAPAAAAQTAFGRSVKPVYHFEKAARIVSLDSDFLHGDAGHLGYARDFAKGRRAIKQGDALTMNRLYVVESAFTLTGGMADHRLRLASSHIGALAAALAAKILNTGDAEVRGLDVNPKWIEECAKDLAGHRGTSLVVAGPQQPAEVHALAYAMNAALGNIGTTVDFVEVPAPAAASIADLSTAIKAGSVKTLFVINGNPAYNAPADLDFGASLKSVSEVIRYGYYFDETSALAGTHLSATHYLESWGDARTTDGTILPIQPMIMPLFNGLMEVELLARLAGEAKPEAYEQVYETITGLTNGGGKKSFEKFLHDGLLEGSAYRNVNVSIRSAATAATIASVPTVSATSLEVRFVTDKVDDGRFANNGWLQECPDPITKISWDNAILVSPRLGKELGILPKGSMAQIARAEEAEFPQGKENAFIGELTVDGRKISGPMHIQPGLANYTVIVPLGYGRTKSGHVGTGAGFDAYPLRTSKTGAFVTGATLTKTDKRFKLANTQEHWSMEGRDIVREANIKEFNDNPQVMHSIGMESHSPAIYKDYTPEQFAKLPMHERIALNAKRSSETPRGNSLYETPNLDGIHQWGMTIDLNTCIGCNACVVACQAENNIPIVGKDQVMRGREMHWIRLDRYYSDGKADGRAMADTFGGERSENRDLPEEPQMVIQPMACQHCEMAPCETVCPVNATVHDDEGLNVMAYNRCIGTRYCANNCPYKVRRFNFFDFNKRATDALYMGPLGHQKEMPELVKMVKNPDVTVRMRGVMEKCTYCVQRIQQAKIAQKRKAGATGNVEIPDGTIKTACQQVCPVDGVLFGNIKDPNSAVSLAKAQERDYAVLGYLNIRPRTTYQGKLRNPNPAMPDYTSLPLSRVEYNNKNHPAHHAETHGESHAEEGKQGGHH